MMKHFKRALTMVLAGVGLVAQSQTMEINGLVSNALTGDPVASQTVLFVIPTLDDSLFTQTNEVGNFNVSITYTEQDSIAVYVSTIDPCNNTTHSRTIFSGDVNPYIHFEICGDTVPPVQCQAYFGYTPMSNDSLTNTNSANSIWFYDYSLGNPTQWQWNFGDGLTSTEQNPLHQYADTGVYDVTLSIAGENCSSSTVSSVYVGTWPHDTTPEVYCQASFGYWAASPNDSVYVDSIATPAENTVYFYDYSWGSPTEWLWNFGDGQTSSEQYPVHVYAQPGNYLVDLSIVSTNCQSSYSSLVFVGTTPYDSLPQINYIAMFYPIINNKTVTFINQSTGNINGYKWNFGDGVISNEINPTHTYFEAGDYLVTLQALYNDSISDIFEMTIGVGYTSNDSIPNAFFLPLFSGREVTFLEIAPGNIVNRNWNFGDGKTSDQQNPTNNYNDLGIYTVSLNAMGLAGYETTFAMQIDLANQTYTGFFNNADATDIKTDPSIDLRATIFPNPVNEQTRLKFESERNTAYYLSIYNSTGKMLNQITYQAFKGNNEVEVNTQNLEKGIYFLRLSTHEKQVGILLFSK